MNEKPKPDSGNNDSEKKAENSIEGVELKRVDTVNDPPKSKTPDTKPKDGTDKISDWKIIRCRYLMWREKRAFRKMQKREKARVTDIAIVVLTGGIVALAFMQWLEMHNGGKQTDRIIVADERLAGAMETTVKQSSKAFEATTNQAILGERAWLTAVPEIHGNSFAMNQPFDVRIVVKNLGKTPALRVRGITNFSFATKDSSGKFKLPIFDKGKEVVFVNLPPDGQMHYDHFFPTVTREGYEGTMSGKIRVYFYGRIDYDDVFGTAHWLTFCNFYVSGGEFVVCTQHNDIDKNESYHPN
jgi:hypothetical protein